MRTRYLLVLAVVLALALTVGMLMGARTAYADPTPWNFIQIPILGYIADSNAGVETIIEVQNLGWDYSKAEIWLWGEYSGYCEPQAPGPKKYECTGLLKPGSSWIWTNAQLPAWAKSAWVIAVDHCGDAWKKGLSNGIPLGVEVVRKGPDPVTGDDVGAAYSAGADLAFWDPVFGGYAFYAPIVFAGHEGFNSWIYIQNSGDQCTSVELWFKQTDDCLRAQICEVLALAPGETYQFDASTCVGPGFQGSVWIRATQPLGIVVDHVGNNVLMSYVGKPAALQFEFNGEMLSVGSQVAYGPLIYREQHGWESIVAVQNLSSIVAAKVKVYFLDNSGDIITTLVDWVCPRGNQLFVLKYVNNLPGNYVGTVRVESQEWWTPGDPKVLPPDILAVAHLLKYSGPTMDELLEAAAYNLFPEWQAFDWQTGPWGVDVIGIPSLMKGGAGVTTELAIHNVSPVPGFVDFAIFIYDQNGLLDFVCEKLNEKQSEYINLDSWGYINPGFKGSAVIQAGPTSEEDYPFGLTAVKVERLSTVLGTDIPGDESTVSEGFPVWGPFAFQGPQDVLGICPGWECRPVIVKGYVYNRTVKDLTGRDEPVVGAEVCLEPGGWCGTTDEKGHFEIANVPVPQGYTVHVYKYGYADPALYRYLNCQTDGLLLMEDIYVRSLHKIEGYAHLGRDCKPLATDARLVGMTVELWADWDGTTKVASTTTNTEGYFKFTNVPEGCYHLKIIGSVLGVAISVPSEDFYLDEDGWAYFARDKIPQWCLDEDWEECR